MKNSFVASAKVQGHKFLNKFVTVVKKKQQT
jgi:hypothetical protein